MARFRRGGVGFFASAFLSFLGTSAVAQDVYINSVWVSRSTSTAGATKANCVSTNGKFYCVGPNAGQGGIPGGTCPSFRGGGNISNNPHIEFGQFLDPSSQAAAECSASTLPSGSDRNNICNSQIYLCTNIGVNNSQVGSSSFSLQNVEFQVFKFLPGINPTDPASAPPLRTFTIDAPGDVPANYINTLPAPPGTPNITNTNSICPDSLTTPTGCGYCVLWDGAININGEFGKSNGQYGFRVGVTVNVPNGVGGSINISPAPRAYPAGTTEDCSCPSTPTFASCGAAGLPGTVNQQPITVDVVDVHQVRSSATVVGSQVGVLAEPINITYRLSKDATTYITVANGTGGTPVLRNLVDGLPRIGEGIPDGTLQNGDSWNGRHNNGGLMPPGVFLVTLQARARDQFGTDLSAPVTRQISLDPLQITDIQVQPLLNLATSLAVLTYTLTEPATTYIDIYPPGTQFCNGLNNLNDTAAIPDDANGNNPPKVFGASLGGCPAGGVLTPVRRIVEQKDFRKSVVSFWDGRDSTGQVMPDGDYVFVLYASLPSQNGFAFAGNAGDKRIWSSTAKSGFIAVSRGLVGISQVSPATTVIGSTPSIAGLNPFVFSYSLSRDAIVSLKIYDSSGLNLKRTLVNREIRPANFLNREFWNDGMTDAGLMLSSGSYLAELTAADPFFPVKVATTTALFQVNMFRITDVVTTPLQSGTTENVQLSYQLSQTMRVAWNLYSPGTIINSATWPPCGQLNAGTCAQTTNGSGQPTKPFLTISGLRPGRLRITEFWDGRDTNGLYVPDGSYVFTLVAQSTTSPAYFASDKVFGVLTVSRGSIVFPVFTVTPTIPNLFNSSATIALPPYEFAYSITRQSSMTIRILTNDANPRIIRSILSGEMRDANLLHKEFWDGRDNFGNFVPRGFYTVQAIASDLASQLSSGTTFQQTLAVDPLRIYDVAVSPLSRDDPSALISYQVSESMKTAIKIYRPGTTFDASANPSPPEAISLVRRIVGVRPARAKIEETWDGRDIKLSQMPDGNYIFKIVASTDISAIDTVTGNVAPGASLANDIPISEVPVVRGVLADPQADFKANTFMYPNPVGASGTTFVIYVPLQSRVTMKIYNLAGELVYQNDFGELPADTYVNGGSFKWNRVNQAGRTVAPGVYFVLVREEETAGAKNVFQVVKKMLLK